MWLVPDKEFYQCPGDPGLPIDSSESCGLTLSKEQINSSSQQTGRKG